MERYRGVLFETRVVDPRPPDEDVGADLLRWCRVFARTGFSPPGESAVGNLSVRLLQGFLVTPTHVPFLDLVPEDLVHVLAVDPDGKQVSVRGRHAPTSEAFLHAAIYARRAEVGAVFHGHCDALLRVGDRLGIPSTGRAVAYGTPELARLAADVAARADLFLLARHGFVALGATADEAGERALAILPRLDAIDGGG